MYLRRVVNEDVNELFALRSNKETMKYIPRPLVKTNEDALAHIAMINEKIDSNQGINWAITLKDSPKLIGIIGHYRLKHYELKVHRFDWQTKSLQGCNTYLLTANYTN